MCAQLIKTWPLTIAPWFLFYSKSTVLSNRAEVATSVDNLAINFEFWKSAESKSEFSCITKISNYQKSLPSCFHTFIPLFMFLVFIIVKMILRRKTCTNFYMNYLSRETGWRQAQKCLIHYSCMDKSFYYSFPLINIVIYVVISETFFA